MPIYSFKIQSIMRNINKQKENDHKIILKSQKVNKFFRSGLLDVFICYYLIGHGEPLVALMKAGLYTSGTFHRFPGFAELY